MLIRLDDIELNAVLAGLRLLQHALEHGDGLPYGIGQIYGHHGPGLTSAQIDQLCQRLNLGSGGRKAPAHA
jgi:hypothetical protein